MNTRKLFLTSLLAAATLSVPAFGAGSTDTILINFTGGRGNSEAVSVTNDPVNGTWNNEAGASQSTPQTLLFSNNTESSATITWSSANTYTTGLAENDKVLTGYLDDGGSQAQITVSNISYTVYDVVVLAATDQAARAFSAVTINGTVYTSAGGIAVAGNDTWGTSKNTTIAPGVNSMTLSGVMGSSLSINGGANSNGARGGIAGIQIFDQTGRIWGATLSGDVNWDDISWSCTDGTEPDGTEPDAKAWSAITADNLTADLSGTGTVTVGAEGVTLNRLRVLSGTTTLAGGTVTFNGSQNEINVLSGATLALNAADVALGTNVSGVNLVGTGTINFKDSFNSETYGKFSNLASFSGTVKFDGAVTLDLGNDALVFSGGSREFAGGLSVSGLGLGVSSGATVTISGGTSSFTGGISSTQISGVEGSDNSVLVSGSGSVLNITDGVLTLSKSIGTRAGGLINQSGGTVTATALRLHDSGSAPGTSTYNLSGGVLNISSKNTANDTSSGVLIGHWGGDSGKGALNVTGGVLNAASTVAVVSWTSPGEMSISGGEVNLKGISLAGQWGGSDTATVTLSGNGRLNIGLSGLATGNSTAHKSFHLNGGTLGALDDWSTGTGVTLNVGGAVEIDTTKRVVSASGASSAATGADAGATITLGNIEFSAAGALTVSGAGMLELAGTVNVGDSGSIALTAGTLKLASTGTLNGTISATGGTLELAGTVNVGDSGSIELTAGTLKLASTGTLNGTISATGGKLELAGKLNLTSAISVADSVSVTISDTTVFNLTNSLKSGDTYTLISGNGTIAGVDWDSLTNSNFTYNGEAIAARGLKSSAAGVVSYDASAATAKTLTWNGDGSAVWKAVTITETPTAKPWLDGETAEAFYNGDSVTFGTGTTNTATLEGSLNVGALTVSAATTFSVADGSTALVTTGTLSLDANLTINDGVTLKLTSVPNTDTRYDGSKILGSGTFAFSASTSGNGSGVDLSEFNGEAYLTGGLLRLGDATCYSSFGANASLRVAAGAALVFNGNASQDGSTFSNAVTFEGSSSVYVNQDKTGELSGSVTAASGTLTKAGAGALTLSGTSNINSLTISNGSVTYSSGTHTVGSISASGKTLTVSGGSLTISGAAASTIGTLAVNSTVEVGGASNTTIGTLSGSSTLTKTGTGTLTVSGETIGADLTLAVDNGTLAWTYPDQVQTTEADITIGTDGVFRTTSAYKYGATFSGTISGAGTFAVWTPTADTNTQSSQSEYARVVTLSGNTSGFTGELQLDTSYGSATANRRVYGVLNTSDGVFGGVVAFKSNLNGKSTTAVVESADCARLYILKDTEIGGLDGALSATLVAGASSVSTNYSAEVVGVVAESHALTINVADGKSYDYAGKIDSTISGITKKGDGIQTLSGDNSAYAGTTRIEGGKLVAASANALGASTASVTVAGGQLKVNGVTLNQTAITVVLGAAYKADGGVAALVGENGGAFAGTVTVDATDLNALGLVAGVANEYSIWDAFLETSGATLELSDAFRTLLADAGWTSSISGGTLTISAIPEPSMFGLLAGLGALALAGTRRRRKKA